MQGTILVINDEYGVRLFDASSPELTRRAMVKVMQERLNDGWYCEPETPWQFSDPLLLLTDEQLQELPAEFRKQTIDRIKSISRSNERNRETHDEEVEWWELLNKVLALPIDDAIEEKTSTGDNAVEWLFWFRKDWEYEDFEFESFESV